MSTSEKRWTQKLTYKVGAWAFAFAKFIIGRKNPLAAERLGARLGRLGMRLTKKHYRRALSNLKLAFPELSDIERQGLARRCFEHFGMLAADVVRTERRPWQEVMDSIVEVEGFEHAQAALAENKGILVITGHFGNWERFGTYLNQIGMALHVVQRDANDPGLNDEIVKMRQAAGMIVLSRGNAAREILRVLKDKKAVGILADQNSGDAFVPFFGYPAGTALGPAVMHIRTGAPLLPSYCVRVGANQFKVIFEEPLKPAADVDDPQLALLTSMNRSLEGVIRKYPEQWLWLHDRWKSARRKGMVPEA